jgi:hypothetical protein
MAVCVNGGDLLSLIGVLGDGHKSECKRRWISLISVGWLPLCESPSRKLPRSSSAGYPKGLEIVLLRVLPIVIRSASPNTPNSVSSARCHRRAGNRPDEAGELACDGDTDLVDVNAAALQVSKATAQADLGLPGMAADGFGLALLTTVEELAQACRIAVTPGAWALPVLVMLPRRTVLPLERSEGTSPR